MALQNFIDRHLPAVSAAWLNFVDVFVNTNGNNGRTAAEIAAGVTVLTANMGYPPLHINRYGAVADDTTDSLAAFNSAILVAKQMDGGTITMVPGGNYLVTTSVLLQYGNIATTQKGITIDLSGGQVRCSGNAPAFIVGANSGEVTAFRGCNIRNGVIRGSGTGNTGSTAILVRNHSYGEFSGLRLTNCGGKAIMVVANTRGVQYNSFYNMDITDNFRGAITIDCGSSAGGYVNDNYFADIRAYSNSAGSQSHLLFQGSVAGETVSGNAFYRCAFETDQGTDTILVMNKGTANKFYGLRLDGVGGSTKAFDLASGCDGNLFFGTELDGTLEDDGNNVWIQDEGSNNFPVIRIGSGNSGAAGSWALGLQQPASQLELHLASTNASYPVVFPSPTQVIYRTSQTAGPITSAVLLSSAVPAIGFDESDAAANNRYWDIIANASTLSFRLANDAQTANNFFNVSRSGNTCTQIVYQSDVHSLRNAGNTESVNIATGGNCYFPRVGTTASAANAFLNNGSTPANELLRSTSSLRYKTDVKDLEQNGILSLRAITYRSLCEADDKEKRWYGLIAEEVAEVDPLLVEWSLDAEGNPRPESVMYDRLTVLLLAKLKEQDKVITDLLDRVAKLEKKA